MINLLALHKFWFGSIEINDAYYQSKVPLWFLGPDTHFDRACRDNFAPWLEQLVISGDDYFANALNSPEPLLAAQRYVATVILFDQIPRNAFRGQARAFAYDHIALQLCLAALGTELETRLSYPERLFLYLPLEHAEDLRLQDLSVQTFEALHANAPAPIVRWTQLALDKAIEHRNTIATHGCFPHRRQIA
ncbi:DUF924 family protein [Parachitinimonas caeni]|uniref:DUF924 domain-containing protein n=1 Tax=Parachitinimonas caeni TaxID=3031301 RepID=A0ABT7DZJ3_9NEIS|nr:DUF924 family protein [Parachitinimonas caeni]MDK2125477.1 DUF924 domain-containing protein [Parachitinimonas caeni]